MFWNKIKERAPEIFLLGATAFLQFFRLGLGEIQSWDEALYLIRSEACIKFGVWVDQTQYAISGLYSSTHPPLVMWIMAFLRMLFGSGVFASRIVSAIAAVTALYFFYKLLGRFFSRWTALFTTISLGCAQNFLLYGHHAQLDIPLFAFITSAAYFAVLGFEENNSKMMLIAGILYGGALLAKAVQGLYLLPFLFALPYIVHSYKGYKKIALLLLTAVVVATPWYIYMMVKHPEFSGDYASLVGSMKAGTYAKEVATKWWYYLNQTIINFPAVILGLFAVIPLIMNRKKPSTHYSRLSISVVVWLIVSIIFLSSFHTKMLHFSLFLLLPTSLLIGFFTEEYLQRAPKWSVIFISSVTLVLVITWSASELIRKSIREQHLPQLHYDFITIVIIVIIIAMLAFLFYKYISSSPQAFVLFIASLVLLSIEYYRWGSRNNETFVDGAEQSGLILLNSPNIRTLSVYHDDYPHESYLPQFNYYTNCWLMGWDPNRSGATRTWGEIDSLIKINNIPKSDAAVLYVSWDAFYKPTEEEKARLMRIDQGLALRYLRSYHSKKYQLYWEPK